MMVGVSDSHLRRVAQQQGTMTNRISDNSSWSAKIAHAG